MSTVSKVIGKMAEICQLFWLYIYVKLEVDKPPISIVYISGLLFVFFRGFRFLTGLMNDKY